MSSTLEDILRSIISVVSELRGIEYRLDTIWGGARRSVQEFTPKVFSERKYYKIYYINRNYYILGINANFFIRIIAESWIDKTEVIRKTASFLPLDS